jgi:hypothetical protein
MIVDHVDDIDDIDDYDDYDDSCLFTRGIVYLL